MQLPNTHRLSVTVIIPTYNRATFIGTAIDSLLTQTRIPDEILVVDDGSTDDTPRILENYGISIKVITQSNQGRSAARNVGLRAATTDLIVFLDSDDMLPPQSIERRARILETSTQIDVVYSDVTLIDGTGNQLGLFSKYRPGARPSGTIFAELALHNIIPCLGAMIRHIKLDSVTFDETLDYCEDFDFWLKIANLGNFAYLEEPLVYYRIHEAMTTTTEPRRMAEVEAKVQERVFAMSTFQQLTSLEKARIYNSHGIKQAMLGHIALGRTYFGKAITTAPTYPIGYVLMAFSLLGLSGFETLIRLQRRAVGNRIVADTLTEIVQTPHS